LLWHFFEQPGKPGANWRHKTGLIHNGRHWNGWPGSTITSLLEPIGYIPPAEAEANYYRQLAKQATEVT
jgi:hypothetical protein